MKLEVKALPVQYFKRDTDKPQEFTIDIASPFELYDDIVKSHTIKKAEDIPIVKNIMDSLGEEFRANFPHTRLTLEMKPNEHELNDIEETSIRAIRPFKHNDEGYYPNIRTFEEVRNIVMIEIANIMEGRVMRSDSLSQFAVYAVNNYFYNSNKKPEALIQDFKDAFKPLSEQELLLITAVIPFLSVDMYYGLIANLNRTRLLSYWDRSVIKAYTAKILSSEFTFSDGISALYQDSIVNQSDINYATSIEAASLLFNTDEDCKDLKTLLDDIIYNLVQNGFNIYFNESPWHKASYEFIKAALKDNSSIHTMDLIIALIKSSLYNRKSMSSEFSDIMNKLISNLDATNWENPFK